MIYPSYKITDAEGNFRTYFWFCFARLKQVDEAPRRYSDFLGEEYHKEGCKPYWEWTTAKGPEQASEVVNIQAAFHVPDWEPAHIELLSEHHLFSDMKITCDEEFVLCSIDPIGKKIDEVMYPLFMLRNILSSLEPILDLEKHGLSFIEAAILGSQFDIASSFGVQKGYIAHVSEDYRLAATFEGLASLVDKPLKYSEAEWGYYEGGYVESFDEDYYNQLPENSYQVGGVDIEDVYEAVYEVRSTEDTFKLIADYFKQAMEKVNEQK